MARPVKPTFGVEIECYVTNESRNYATAYNCEAHGDIHNDGSLGNAREDERPREFVTRPLPLDATGYAALAKYLRALRNYDARVDRSTGLHVHLRTAATYKMEHDPVIFSRAIIAALEYEPLFFGCVPESRKSNHFARRLLETSFYGGVYSTSRGRVIADPISKDADAQKAAIYGTTRINTRSKYARKTGSRYSWFNTAPLHVFPHTLEIRLHQGSMDARKIIGWIRVCAEFLNWATGEQRAPFLLSCSEAVRRVVITRLKEYARNPHELAVIYGMSIPREYPEELSLNALGYLHTEETLLTYKPRMATCGAWSYV